MSTQLNTINTTSLGNLKTTLKSNFKSALKNTRTLAIVAMILSMLCWESGTIVTKVTLAYFPPVMLLVIQLFVSSIALWIAVFATRSHKGLTFKSIAHGASGILEPGLAYVLGIQGLALTSMSNVSIIGALEPLMIVVLAWIILRDKVSRQMWTLIIVGLIGTILVTFSTDASHHSITGDLLIVAEIFCASLYAVVSKGSTDKVAALPLTALQQTFGLGAAVIALVLSTQQVTLDIPTSAWIGAIATGVIQYAGGFLFYIVGIKHMSTSNAAMYLMLLPIVGMGGAVLVLGESLSVPQLLGSGFVLFALIQTTMKRQAIHA